MIINCLVLVVLVGTILHYICVYLVGVCHCLYVLRRSSVWTVVAVESIVAIHILGVIRFFLHIEVLLLLYKLWLLILLIFLVWSLLSSFTFYGLLFRFFLSALSTPDDYV